MTKFKNNQVFYFAKIFDISPSSILVWCANLLCMSRLCKNAKSSANCCRTEAKTWTLFLNGFFWNVCWNLHTCWGQFYAQLSKMFRNSFLFSHLQMYWNKSLRNSSHTCLNNKAWDKVPNSENWALKFRIVKFAKIQKLKSILNSWIICPHFDPIFSDH